MPQGIKHASHCFQRTMKSVFADLEDCVLPPYYDDIIIKSDTFTQHLKNTKLVLQRIRNSGFTLNALKCHFFQTKLSYLGHIIEDGTVSLDPDRMKTIVKFPRPQDVKQIRRFIGMAQFCHRFTPKLNEILTPLYHLTKSDLSFAWSTACENSFVTVKQLLFYY